MSLEAIKLKCIFIDMGVNEITLPPPSSSCLFFNCSLSISFFPLVYISLVCIIYSKKKGEHNLKEKSITLLSLALSNSDAALEDSHESFLAGEIHGVNVFERH